MTASSHVTTPKDIRQAATALEGVAVRTNLDRSERLSTEAGVDILLKREDQQKCRSFKVRGAYARMSLLSPAERERGVVCASAGNHAQGLAYACAHLGVRGTIYLPSNTSPEAPPYRDDWWAVGRAGHRGWHVRPRERAGTGGCARDGPHLRSSLR